MSNWRKCLRCSCLEQQTPQLKIDSSHTEFSKALHCSHMPEALPRRKFINPAGPRPCSQCRHNPELPRGSLIASAQGLSFCQLRLPIPQGWKPRGKKGSLERMQNSSLAVRLSYLGHAPDSTATLPASPKCVPCTCSGITSRGMAICPWHRRGRCCWRVRHSILLLFCEKGIHCNIWIYHAAQGGLKLMILLPQPPKC